MEILSLSIPALVDLMTVIITLPLSSLIPKLEHKRWRIGTM
jgi:hypothetical protein